MMASKHKLVEYLLFLCLDSVCRMNPDADINLR